MFEKEAEEYLKKDGTKAEQILNVLNEISPLKITIKQLPFVLAMSKQIFQDGAEFGYNKANEWHYVKDGDYPKEDTAEKETLYLLWFGLDDSDYLTGLFSHGRFWCFDSGWFETNEVIAWKEIVLPELKESE